MNNIEAPFTQEQVDCINRFQQSSQFHPFTCCGDDIPECQRSSGENQGILIANTDGLICPCSKYKQDWVTEYMSKYKHE